jgi:hypothetical protein
VTGQLVLDGRTRRADVRADLTDYEKFASIGAIGPDLYFSQDYNGLPLGPISDELMFTLACGVRKTRSRR